MFAADLLTTLTEDEYRKLRPVADELFIIFWNYLSS